MDRRLFLKYIAAGSAGAFLPRVGRADGGNAGPLDPTQIPKYVQPLVIPPAMPRTSRFITPGRKPTDYYEIAVRQFRQQIMPPGLPATTVWGYGSVNHPGTFNYPSFTIEAKWDTPVRVKWINDLVDANGNYLPHLLAVDPTLHWANPGGGTAGRDTRPEFTSTPARYTGPVPIVTHVHGAHVQQESDGYPEAWFLPDARDIPPGYARTGTFYDDYKQSSPLGDQWAPGSAVFQYPNDQRASTLWYHDHALGMTRLNVQAGPAGFYNLRGGPTDLPAGILPGPGPALGDPPGMAYYEIPIVIQDRSFNPDGSLFYPDSRAFFDGFEGPYIPVSDISPIFNPEVFGNAIVVNGRTWPYLEVEQRRYRFRLLNGCNARFLVLKIAAAPPIENALSTPALPFWQIGAEGGFLPAPVQLPQLLMGLAERADVIVDFTNVPAGTMLYLVNEAPDEPFGGGVAWSDFAGANPATTGQIMQLRVVKRKGADKSTPPHKLALPPFKALGAESNVRKVSLNEADSKVLAGVGPREAQLGTVDGGEMGMPMMWMDAVTENPAAGTTEVWEIHNYTMDAHPIHLHLVQFQVVDRQKFLNDGDPMTLIPAEQRPPARPPEAWESGYKDTVLAYPGEITRIKAHFDLKGRYVWHCHIIEHEDNEMMRPMDVV